MRTMLVPALSLLVVLLTFVYGWGRMTPREFETPSRRMRKVGQRIAATYTLPSQLLESLIILVLLSRGISGLTHVPKTATRIEDSWVLLIYVAVGIAHAAALATDHRFGRQLCCLAQMAIWLVLAIMIPKLTGEVTDSFQWYAVYMAWIAIRLRA